MSDTPPAAGWYPDPQNPNQQRYWDGTAWTQHAGEPGKGGGAKRYLIPLIACVALALILGIAGAISGGDEDDAAKSTTTTTEPTTTTTTTTRVTTTTTERTTTTRRPTTTTPPTTARPRTTESPDAAKVDAVETSFRSYAAGSDLLDNVTGFESFAGGNGVQINTDLFPDADARALSSRWCGLAGTWIATYGEDFDVEGIRIAASDGQRVALSRGTSGCEQADF